MSTSHFVQFIIINDNLKDQGVVSRKFLVPFLLKGIKSGYR